MKLVPEACQNIHLGHLSSQTAFRVEDDFAHNLKNRKIAQTNFKICLVKTSIKRNGFSQLKSFSKHLPSISYLNELRNLSIFYYMCFIT